MTQVVTARWQLLVIFLFAVVGVIHSARHVARQHLDAPASDRDSGVEGWECEGLWIGHWRYMRMKGPMELHLRADFRAGTLFGEGQDEVGEFKIEGTVDTKRIHFIKNYKGEHSVEYVGTSRNRGKKYRGMWSLQEVPDHVKKGHPLRMGHPFVLRPRRHCLDTVKVISALEVNHCGTVKYRWSEDINKKCQGLFGPRSHWNDDATPFCALARKNCHEGRVQECCTHEEGPATLATFCALEGTDTSNDPACEVSEKVSKIQEAMEKIPALADAAAFIIYPQPAPAPAPVEMFVPPAPAPVAPSLAGESGTIVADPPAPALVAPSVAGGEGAVTAGPDAADPADPPSDLAGEGASAPATAEADTGADAVAQAGPSLGPASGAGGNLAAPAPGPEAIVPCAPSPAAVASPAPASVVVVVQPCPVAAAPAPQYLKSREEYEEELRQLIVEIDVQVRNLSEWRAKTREASKLDPYSIANMNPGLVNYVDKLVAVGESLPAETDAALADGPANKSSDEESGDGGADGATAGGSVHGMEAPAPALARAPASAPAHRRKRRDDEDDGSKDVSDAEDDEEDDEEDSEKDNPAEAAGQSDSNVNEIHPVAVQNKKTFPGNVSEDDDDDDDDKADSETDDDADGDDVSSTGAAAPAEDLSHPNEEEFYHVNEDGYEPALDTEKTFPGEDVDNSVDQEDDGERDGSAETAAQVEEKIGLGAGGAGHASTAEKSSEVNKVTVRKKKKSLRERRNNVVDAEDGEDEDDIQRASRVAAASTAAQAEKTRKLQRLLDWYSTNFSLRMEEAVNSIETGVHPHGLRWWKNRYEQSLMEAMFLLPILWGLFFLQNRLQNLTAKTGVDLVTLVKYHDVVRGEGYKKMFRYFSMPLLFNGFALLILVLFAWGLNHATPFYDWYASQVRAWWTLCKEDFSALPAARRALRIHNACVFDDVPYDGLSYYVQILSILMKLFGACVMYAFFMWQLICVYVKNMHLMQAVAEEEDGGLGLKHYHLDSKVEAAIECYMQLQKAFCLRLENSSEYKKLLKHDARRVGLDLDLPVTTQQLKRVQYNQYLLVALGKSLHELVFWHWHMYVGTALWCLAGMGSAYWFKLSFIWMIPGLFFTFILLFFTAERWRGRLWKSVTDDHTAAPLPWLSARMWIRLFQYVLFLLCYCSSRLIFAYDIWIEHFHFGVVALVGFAALALAMYFYLSGLTMEMVCLLSLPPNISAQEVKEYLQEMPEVEIVLAPRSSAPTTPLRSPRFEAVRSPAVDGRGEQYHTS